MPPANTKFKAPVASTDQKPRQRTKIVLCRWLVEEMFQPARYCGRNISRGKKDYCDVHLARLPIWP